MLDGPKLAKIVCNLWVIEIDREIGQNFRGQGHVSRAWEQQMTRVMFFTKRLMLSPKSDPVQLKTHVQLFRRVLVKRVMKT